MTRYDHEKEKIIKLEGLQYKWDPFDSILRSILRMNLTWYDGTLLTESDAFAVLFMHAVTEKKLNVLSEYHRSLNELYGNIKDTLDRCNIEIFVPDLSEFKWKYLLSNYSSDRKSISAVLDFMKDNYGISLSESRKYVKEVEEMATDMLIIKSVRSLSREDLIDFNVELLSSMDYGEKELAAREKSISERERKLISKYSGTELNYKFDKDYLLIVADKAAIAEDKEEIRKRKTTDCGQISGLSTEELQDKLIMGLCSSAVQAKKQIEIYNAERTLSKLGILSFTKDDLDNLVSEERKLNELFEKRDSIESAIDEIELLFDGSVEIKQLRSAYVMCLSLRDAFNKAGDEFNKYGNILKIKSSEYWEINKNGSSKATSRRKTKELLREKQQEITEASSKEKEFGELYKETDIKLFTAKQEVIKSWSDIKAILDYHASKHIKINTSSCIDEILACETIEDFDELMRDKKEDIICTLRNLSSSILKEIETSETVLFDTLLRTHVEPKKDNEVTLTYINNSVNTILSHESEMELVRTTELSLSKGVISDAHELANGDPHTGKEIIAKKVRALKYK